MRRQPDQYLANFTDSLVGIGLVRFGHLMPIRSDRAAVGAVGFNYRWGCPRDLGMKQIKQNLLASQRVPQTVGQVRVDQVGRGKQSRNLVNIRVAISKELVAESNSYGIAATNRHEAGEQSVGLQYAIATRRGASFRTLLQTGSPQIIASAFYETRERRFGDASIARSPTEREHQFGSRQTSKPVTSGRAAPCLAQAWT